VKEGRFTLGKTGNQTIEDRYIELAAKRGVSRADALEDLAILKMAIDGYADKYIVQFKTRFMDEWEDTSYSQTQSFTIEEAERIVDEMKGAKAEFRIIRETVTREVVG
jgi:hypothetical protein